MRPGAYLLAITVLATTGVIAEPDLMRFEPEQIIAWPTVKFAGQTVYSLQDAQAAGASHAAVRAACDSATASGLILERQIDLEVTPIVEWHWRIDSVYSDLDERSKRGDDYPARVYVVAQRWPQWRSRVISYVWSNAQPVGSDWPNAFAGQFRMLAVRSGSEGLGQWHSERRDVRADFRALHGIDLDTIDALAIMTDCDNAGQSTTAWYGPIRWLSGP